MKISLNALASVNKENTVSFMNMTGVSYQQIEKYVGGQYSKISRLRAKVYRAQDLGKIEKDEFEEIVMFCEDNMAIIQKIARNFDLFKNVGVPKNSYAGYADRVNSLLKKEERK